MSLQISAQGTREGVLKHVSEQPGKLPVGTDQKQVDAVKALIAAEVAAMPEGTNGLRLTVEASAHNGARTIQVTLLPLQVHV